MRLGSYESSLVVSKPALLVESALPAVLGAPFLQTSGSSASSEVSLCLRQSGLSPRDAVGSD